MEELNSLFKLLLYYEANEIEYHIITKSFKKRRLMKLTILQSDKTTQRKIIVYLLLVNSMNATHFLIFPNYPT